MRTRKVFKAANEIKKNPDIRMVFAKPNWPDFVAGLKMADDLEANVGQVARQIYLNFVRRYAKADKPTREAMSLEVIQGLHGVLQLQLFTKKKPRRPSSVRKPPLKKTKRKVVKKDG